MSKITRRDFLKTAGVMTLAVAAAGVLAGCDGAEKPVAPETGAKALGEITKIGDMEFSVVKAVQQDDVKVELVDNAAKETVEASKLCVLMSVRNTAAESNFNFLNVNLYVNGKRADTKGRAFATAPEAIQKHYDVKAFDPATGYASVKPSKTAGYYEFYIDLTETDVYGDPVPVTAAEVTYYNAVDKTAVTYTIPAPLTVVKNYVK